MSGELKKQDGVAKIAYIEVAFLLSPIFFQAVGLLYVRPQQRWGW